MTGTIRAAGSSSRKSHAFHVAGAALIAALVATAVIAATPETEPNGTTATATSIPSGGQCLTVMSTAAINPAGDLDFFSFAAVAGHRVWVVTDSGGAQNGGATSRDTVMDLIDFDGTTVIETDDDDSSGNGGDGTVETALASIITGRALPNAGPDYLRVRAFLGGAVVDPYRLLFAESASAPIPEIEANDTTATANPVAGCQIPTSGSIGVAGDADYYSVNLTAGKVALIAADADPERDGTGTNLVVELRDASDVLLFAADSSSGGSLGDPAGEGFAWNTTVSGTYFIKVRHFFPDGGTGTYHLLVAEEGPTYAFTDVVDAPLNTLITSNAVLAPATGNISISGDNGAAYSINGGAFTSTADTVTAGDQVRVQVLSSMDYSITTSLTLDIDGNLASFNVTTVDPPVLSFTSASQSKSENITPVTITVELDAPAQLEASIPFTIGGTATSPADYSIPTASPLIIPVGQSSASITVNVVNDPIDEPDQTVIVTLGAPTNASLGATTVHTFTILDNDLPPKVSFTAANQSHAESGAFTVTVKLSNPSAFAFDVPFSVGGTASGADRVVSTASPLTFNPGDTSKTINGTITSDPLDELDETVIFTLGEPTGDPTLGTPAVHTLNILDDDLSPRVTMIPLNQTVGEGVGTASITFQLDALSGLPVIVPLTYGGTAAAPGDYLAGPSSITIPAGDISSNLELTIVNNLVHETTEVIQISAGGAAAGRRAVPTKGTITITDND
jgi:hypothetical protein